MKAEISTMSGNSTFSPMADVHDNSAMPIDFHALADKISAAADSTLKQAVPVVEEQAGVMRTLWNGIVEDVMGRSSSSSSAGGSKGAARNAVTALGRNKAVA